MNKDDNEDIIVVSVEVQSETCPGCHRIKALTISEAQLVYFVCDMCYAQDIGRSMDEGFGPNMS